MFDLDFDRLQIRLLLLLCQIVCQLLHNLLIWLPFKQKNIWKLFFIPYKKKFWYFTIKKAKGQNIYCITLCWKFWIYYRKFEFIKRLIKSQTYGKSKVFQIYLTKKPCDNSVKEGEKCSKCNQIGKNSSYWSDHVTSACWYSFKYAIRVSFWQISNRIPVCLWNFSLGINRFRDNFILNIK